jgi:hypothetical protein
VISMLLPRGAEYKGVLQEVEPNPDDSLTLTFGKNRKNRMIAILSHKDARAIARALGWKPPSGEDVMEEADTPSESEREFSVSGVFSGSKYLGNFKAKTRAEAIDKGLASEENSLSLCHQCNDEIELDDISCFQGIASEVK